MEAAIPDDAVKNSLETRCEEQRRLQSARQSYAGSSSLLLLKFFLSNRKFLAREIRNGQPLDNSVVAICASNGERKDEAGLNAV
jgi:hypothetical protein